MLYACLQLDPDYSFYTVTFWVGAGSDLTARVEVTYGAGQET